MVSHHPRPPMETFSFRNLTLRQKALRHCYIQPPSEDSRAPTELALRWTIRVMHMSSAKRFPRLVLRRLEVSLLQPGLFSRRSVPSKEMRFSLELTPHNQAMR